MEHFIPIQSGGDFAGIIYTLPPDEDKWKDEYVPEKTYWWKEEIPVWTVPVLMIIIFITGSAFYISCTVPGMWQIMLLYMMLGMITGLLGNSNK